MATIRGLPPLPAPSASHFFRHAGFTLIELLVVLVVMGIALGMVVVQLMPDERTTLRHEADYLALLLENAEMEAQSSGRPMAWSAEKNGYRFWKKSDYGEWVRLDDDAMFKPHTFPDGMGITTVTVETKPLQADEVISLNAFTFTLPFSIRLSSGQASAFITGNTTGAVSAVLDTETNG